MKMLTILEFAKVLVSYLFVTLYLPSLLLRRRLCFLSLTERVMAYFLAGNFYVINLVFLLQFLKISGRVTLLLGSLVPFVIAFLWKKVGIRERVGQWLRTIHSLLNKELGIKTFLLQKKKEYRALGRGEQFRGRKGLRYLPELLLWILLGAVILKVYGLPLLEQYGYKASDVPVHNYWINAMGENRIFVAGVYPHGFHIILYYLHTVFGIPTYVLMRVFALVETLLIHYMILLFLKGLCKSRFIPYIGLGLYVVPGIYGVGTYTRYLATLPQEFGMLFILPAAYFAIVFFQRYDEKRKEVRQQYLFFFMLSLSLSLAAHFYDTIVLGVFCVGIGLGFFFRLFQPKYLGKIVAAGILGIVLAVIPLVIGVAVGNKLEGSLYWAMGVMKGKDSDSSSSNTVTVTLTPQDQTGNSTGTGGTKAGTESTGTGDKEAGTESTGTGGKEAGIENTGTGDGSNEAGTEQTTQPAKDPLSARLKRCLFKIRDQISDNVFASRMFCAKLTLACIACLFVQGLIFVLLGKRSYGGLLWSMGFLGILMSVLQSLAALGLPELMDTSRTSIFMAYFIGLFFAMCMDGVLTLFLGWTRHRWIQSIASFLLLTVLTGVYAMSPQLKRKVVPIARFESNGAIICLTNIIRENKDFTWTIVSANDELRMCEDYGYHSEPIRLLHRLEHMKEGDEVTIPTKYVYFYVEKEMVNYAYYEPLDQRISVEGAMEPLPVEEKMSSYRYQNRWIVMSHLYYWAEAFKTLYPNEMTVYYEDDKFICYRLEQNVDSLYNLLIDYGYNDPGKGEE